MEYNTAVRSGTIVSRLTVFTIPTKNPARLLGKNVFKSENKFHL